MARTPRDGPTDSPAKSRVIRQNPIADKVIAGFQKLGSRKVIPLDEHVMGKKRVDDLYETVASSERLARLEPAHGIYVFVQNQVSIFAEVITELREMKRFCDLLEKAEDTYLPSGPPMSPLTASYFTCWAFFDACIGLHRETIGTCMLQLGTGILKMDPEFLRVLRLMQASRMGLYVHEGSDGHRVALRELYTGSVYRCIVPSGHRGSAGELWYARVLPPPHLAFPDHVVFTTPYVVVRPGVAEWHEYLARSLAGKATTYEDWMKFGPDRSYWNEYVLEAYLGNRNEVIFLGGLPDVAESRPHSTENS